MIATPRYYSQCGQDQLIDELLWHKRRGVFVDVGAADGETNSNTLFFEETRDWHGLLVEPHPAAAAACRARRSSSVVECAILSRSDNYLTEFRAISGEYSQMSYAIDRADRLNIDRIAKYAQKSPLEESIIMVQVCPLQALLDKFNLHHIDYLSIDTEGADLDVVQTIDWTRTTATVISTEKQANPLAIDSFLTSIGYKIIHDLGWENIWLKT
jgi:FkbM family methyltransferase